MQEYYISTGEIFFAFLMTAIISLSFYIGALFSFYIKIIERIRGDIASISAGIFFSAITFILIDESIRLGSFTTMMIGFIAGLVTFSLSNKFLKQIPSSDSTKLNKNFRYKEIEKIQNKPQEKYLSIPDGKNKIRQRQNSEVTKKRRALGYGNIIIVGKLMDSLSKSLFVGIMIALDLIGLLATLMVLFLGNLSAAIEGSRRMLLEGKDKKQILHMWTYVSLPIAIAGPIGYLLSSNITNSYISIIIGFAAGDLMAFLMGDLIPEAYKTASWHTGLSAGIGFIIGATIFHFLR